MRDMTQEQSQAWLASLKPGDEVAVRVSGMWHRTGYELTSITRVTKTQFVLGEGDQEMRAARINGRVVGGSRTFRYMEPLTDDIRAKFAEAEMRAWLRDLQHVSVSDMPLSVIVAMRGAAEVELKRLADEAGKDSTK